MLSTVAIALPANAADLAPGGRCALGKTVRLSVEARGKGKKIRVKKGTELEVVAVVKRWAEGGDPARCALAAE